MFCKPPHPVYIVLFRGDDTDFVGNQEIIVKITTERNISGCKAYFKYMGNIQTFDEIPEDKELHLVFSREQTKEMPLGTWDAELYLIDENGKRMTVNNRIHMLVTNSVREAYFPDDPQAVSVVISANKYIEDAEVSADGKTLTLTKKDGTEVSFSGGGGGTNDYNDLENKPSINGTTLTGNINLATPEQLSLKADKTNVYTKAEVDEKVDAVDNKADDAHSAAEQMEHAVNSLAGTIGTHIRDTDNPHKVTAAQVGALPFVEDADGKKTAVTIGSRSGIVGPYSIANGNNVTASGEYSHAEGYGTTASGYYSHAEGGGTAASGEYSHAEGGGTAASGECSHAEGGGTAALGGYSHAEGSGTTASGVCSHADGYVARAKDDYAYSWNGNYKTDIPYDSHGPGTFNINPIGGVNGFYVGEKKLSEVISDGIADKADKATTLAGYGITDAATEASIAPEYSPSSAYSVGAFVYHDGNIYQCTTAIADGGEEWNAAHWELRKLDDFFTNSNSLLTGTIDAEVISKGTAPDAHLEAPTDERLKLILADSSVAYDSAKALPYKLTSVIGDRVIATMTLTAASTDITLPTIASNDTTVKDFILDVTNAYAVEGVATDAGINIPRTDFKLVTRDGESLTDVTTVKAGKSAFICFTQKSPVVVDGTTYPCWCVIQLPFGDPS